MVTEVYSLIRQTEQNNSAQCLNRPHRALRIAIFVPSEWFDYLLSSQCIYLYMRYYESALKERQI
jgi:hypothetical protein